MHRVLVSTNAAAFILFVLAFGASPAGDKPAPWKPFLPEDAHDVLAMRSRTTVMEMGKAGNKERVEVEEAIIAGYALSVERKSGGLKEGARQEEIAKLRTKMQRKELFAEMMETFRNRAKQRVDGIHADLQYLPKLKNQNSVEALIGALANKKLSEENLAKVEKELPLLSYRIAVMANLSQHAAPRGIRNAGPSWRPTCANQLSRWRNRRKRRMQPESSRPPTHCRIAAPCAIASSERNNHFAVGFTSGMTGGIGLSSGGLRNWP